MKTVLLCTAVTAVLIAGCGDRKIASQGPSATPSASSSASSPAAVPPSPSAEAEKTASIQSYYGNADMSALVAKPASIRYAKENEKYLAALNALKKSPSADTLSLCPDITFRSVKAAEGALTVDLTVPDKSRLGSGGEAMLLEAFKKTLFQFSEVQSFEILVDGKKTDSLMGHMELLYPFKR
ncbi:GerMN domain-containing protein [Gorillibacterium sp. sgz5001074]|uniref:GerMN domain-containing protein n=1 Tax=Gorillibacterium sp. sgz5001074 TaxID=3446695 RepID=UPI003F66C546